jgi:nicotinamide-nucleotide amidase
MHSARRSRASRLVTPTSDKFLSRIAARVGQRLTTARLTLTAAESCTGGWISKVVTDVAGSSRWFKEGFVTYSNEAKHERLGVSNATLGKHGAVSEATARAMAAGALRRAHADVAVAVTGIAGPGGGVPGKPVGTVWIAWARRRGRRVQLAAELRHFRGDRESIRRKTVGAAMRGLMLPNIWE